MAELTPKQQRFVDEYLIDLNATQAAIRAGYSVKTAQEQSSRLLSKAIVKNAVKATQEKLAASAGVTPEKIVKEYARLAFSTMRDFASFGPDGVTLKDLETMDEDAARCIAEVSESKTIGGGSVKFKLHDKKGALDSLARHLGMFNDKVEHSGAMTVNVLKFAGR